MNIWDILEIEPTTDIFTIKKAYAAAAKKCHPEEKPDEFRLLQNAYRIALKYAEGTKVNENIVSENSNTEAGNTEDVRQEEKLKEFDPEDLQPDFNYEEIMSEEAVEDELAQLEADFWSEIYTVIWHPYLRNSIYVWDYYFTRSRYALLFHSSDFRDRFILRLCDEKNIWKVDTIRFIDFKFKSIRKGASVYETSRECWLRLLHFEPRRSFVTLVKFCTKEEKSLYNKLWDKKKKREIMSDPLRMEEY